MKASTLPAERQDVELEKRGELGRGKGKERWYFFSPLPLPFFPYFALWLTTTTTTATTLLLFSLHHHHHHHIPEGINYMKEGFRRCHDWGAVTHKNAKTLETNFYSPSKEENEEED